MHSTFFQFGRLHIPVFGVFAAVGLMAALGLSQSTARYAKLDPDAVWNAMMAAVVSAFLISRSLLVIFNWHSFLDYPLLVLALPSLTSLGVLLTCLFMVAYLRWRVVPLLQFLDAVAPCAALLCAFVSLGRFMEGTREGMLRGFHDGAPPKVHPVELYSVCAAAAICVVSTSVLKRVGQPGRTAGVGFALAGLAIYLIDFFRLPSDLLSNAWLDPAQAIAIVMIVVGAVLAVRRESKMQRATGSEGTDAI